MVRALARGQLRNGSAFIRRVRYCNEPKPVL
jgi:hypothetical protein